MKKILTPCTALVALLSFLAIAHASPGCADVEVRNLVPGGGPLMLAAYSNAASFRKTAARQMQVGVTGETLQVEVCGLQGDSVALTVFQDLDGDGKLNTNPFGMPTEPWGASGQPTRLSAPTWESAMVPLDGARIVVRLGR